LALNPQDITAEERNQHGARGPGQAAAQQVGSGHFHTLDEGLQHVSLADKKKHLRNRGFFV